jgi:type IV pilus assembly protein PilM
VGERGILGLLKKDLIGLDVDMSSVRMVQLRRKNGEYSIVGAAATDVEPWGGDQGQHRANTVRAIRQSLDALGSSAKLAVCGLRGPEVVVRGFEFPGLPSDEIEGAVQLDASQACPFSSEDITLDYQVMSDKERKAQGYWVAATGRLIEDRRQLAREAGLQCALIDVDGLALLNCLEHVPAGVSQRTGHRDTVHTDGPRAAILHVGDSYATIAIMDQACRPFVRDVSSSGQEIIRQVAREARMSEDAVLTALLANTPVDKAIPQGSLEKACVHLLDDIVTTLRYYAAQNPLARVNRVLVCGRFGLITGILDLLSAKLPFQVGLWNPVSSLRCEANPECEATLRKTGPAMAIATGLAMRRI